jgi:RecA-family ATPase
MSINKPAGKGDPGYRIYSGDEFAAMHQDNGPLFGLDRLTKVPDAIVLMVESEAQVRFIKNGGYNEAFDFASRPIVGVSPPRGANGVAKADFTPLAKREVVIVPRYGAAGERWADSLVQILQKVVRKLQRWHALSHFRSGWGVGDPLPEGCDPDTLVTSMLQAPEVTTQSDAGQGATYAGVDGGFGDAGFGDAGPWQRDDAPEVEPTESNYIRCEPEDIARLLDEGERQTNDRNRSFGSEEDNNAAQAGQQRSSKTGALPLPFIDVRKWCDQPPPEREWSTPGRFPLRQVALLSGEGAVGKSIVLLQLCAAHILGRDWLNALPVPGPAMYVGAEDEEQELHRRMAAIMAHLGAPMSDLVGKFHALSLAGQDAVLARFDRRSIVRPTPLFGRLKECACDIKPKLIALDTAADVFAGQENDRAQVRQFIGLLRSIAIPATATVLLCAHPSLTGISTGSGISGSTAWHNSVRARAYLQPVTTDKGDEPDPDLRVLQFMKNNYGPIAERVLLRWKNGVFVPEPGAGSLEKLAADQKVDERFLRMLAQFEQQGRNVSDKATAPNYAPTTFAKEPAANGVRKEAFAAAMRRLFAVNRIHLQPYGPPSRGTSRLASGPKS